MRAQYFTRDGCPLSEREAHDRNGVIRDGVVMRVPMQFRDHAAVDPRLRFTSGCHVTDGQGGVAGLHRPGFRIAARRDLRGRLEGTFEEEEEEDTERQTSDAATRARDAAYHDYEKALTTAYKNPVRHGEGSVPADYEDEIEEHVSTHHEGLGRNHRWVDHRTVAQMMRDHQNKMTDIYDKLDHELSEAWRRS